MLLCLKYNLFGIFCKKSVFFAVKCMVTLKIALQVFLIKSFYSEKYDYDLKKADFVKILKLCLEFFDFKVLRFYYFTIISNHETAIIRVFVK